MSSVLTILLILLVTLSMSTSFKLQSKKTTHSQCNITTSTDSLGNHSLYIGNLNRQLSSFRDRLHHLEGVVKGTLKQLNEEKAKLETGSMWDQSGFFWSVREQIADTKAILKEQKDDLANMQALVAKVKCQLKQAILNQEVFERMVEKRVRYSTTIRPELDDAEKSEEWAQS